MISDLGTLGGATSIALAVNDADQIVGDANIASGAQHAFVWQEGKMTDLNALIPAGSGWVLTEAQSINNNKAIVGRGIIGGQTHAFLLTPARGN